MSQPCDRTCSLPAPGEVDEELGEFWEGTPWKIFEQHNLSCFERNRVFLNARGGNFVDISSLTGADSDGDGRAVIAFDTDGDGRLEILVRQAGGGPLLLFENRFPAQRFLKVTLRGTESNRLAVGARLIAHAEGQQIVRELYPVNSLRSQAPLVTHFGLGDAGSVERLTVHWPSGRVQHFDSIQADQHVLLVEGRKQVEVLPPGRAGP